MQASLHNIYIYYLLCHYVIEKYIHAHMYAGVNVQHDIYIYTVYMYILVYIRTYAYGWLSLCICLCIDMIQL